MRERKVGKELDRPFFSIIVVTLNPGEKLSKTIESICSQSCGDYEVVVKDGGSRDYSLEELKARKKKENEADFWNRVEIYEEPDKSIYEGMNQATKHARGQYLYFLNCGDYFHDENVLGLYTCEQIQTTPTKYGYISKSLRNPP